METKKTLQLKVVEINGRVFVEDTGQGVMSEHKSVFDAEVFIMGILEIYNGNNKTIN